VSGLGKIQRCSRPLCSSQATDEPTWATRNHQHRHAGWSGCDPVTRTFQKHSTSRPVASGPNSVLGKPTRVVTTTFQPTHEGPAY
jgi:hypothetical protein